MRRGGRSLVALALALVGMAALSPIKIRRPERTFPCWPFMAAAAGMTRAWRSQSPWQSKASG